jgi:hypothetical protein
LKGRWPLNLLKKIETDALVKSREDAIIDDFEKKELPQFAFFAKIDKGEHILNAKNSGIQIRG